MNHISPLTETDMETKEWTNEGFTVIDMVKYIAQHLDESHPDHPANSTPPDKSIWADTLSVRYLSRAELEERIRDRSQRAKLLEKHVEHEFILDMSAFARGTGEQQCRDMQTEGGMGVTPLMSETDIVYTATRYKAFEQWHGRLTFIPPIDDAVKAAARNIGKEALCLGGFRTLDKYAGRVRLVIAEKMMVDKSTKE